MFVFGCIWVCIFSFFCFQIFKYVLYIKYHVHTRCVIVCVFKMEWSWLQFSEILGSVDWYLSVFWKFSAIISSNSSFWFVLFLLRLQLYVCWIIWHHPTALRCLVLIIHIIFLLCLFFYVIFEIIDCPPSWLYFWVNHRFFLISCFLFYFQHSHLIFFL
jgi:hypothetical protein